MNSVEGIDVVELKKVLNKAVDWCQLAPNAWLLQTPNTSQVWVDRFLPLMADGHFVFVVKQDLTERQGFLPKFVWDWIYRQIAPTPTTTDQ
jgi:hypothetical protein